MRTRIWKGAFRALLPTSMASRTGFNRTFERNVERYRNSVQRVVDRKWLALAIYAATCVLLAVLFVRLPGGFLPNEDQGGVMVQYRLPPGATRERTEEVQRAVEDYFLTNEGKNIAIMFTLAGGGFGASGQNTGQGFARLVDWDDRPGKENSADAITQRASKALEALRDAQAFVLVPGSVRGLGTSAGFEMELQNSGGLSREKFAELRDELLEKANADSRLTSVRLTDLPDVSTLKVDIDTKRLTAYGLTTNDVNSTLSTAWGGSYVNDFIDQGRVKRVYVQGDAQYRSSPDDIGQWYVRSANGEMSPFSAFATSGWSTTPSTTSRFNGLPTYEITGQAAPGVSSGTAMDAIEELANQLQGTSVAWAGASYQERLSSGQAPLLYALSLLVVFLCLAALYESWSIPVGSAFGDTAWPGRRDICSDPARAAERCVSSNRPAGDDGPCRQEFHPDDRVRRAGGKARYARDRCRAGSGAHSSASDPDDQLRFYLRRHAAGPRHGRRRKQPDSHWHLGGGRHVDRYGAGDLLYPAVLRDRPARHARHDQGGA